MLIPCDLEIRTYTLLGKSSVPCSFLLRAEVACRRLVFMTNTSAPRTICGLTTGQVITCERAFITPLGSFFRAGEKIIVGNVHTEGQMSVLCHSAEPHASGVWISDGLLVIDERPSREWNARQDAHHKAMRDELVVRRGW